MKKQAKFLIQSFVMIALLCQLIACTKGCSESADEAPVSNAATASATTPAAPAATEQAQSNAPATGGNVDISNIDLTADANGLSKATVIVKTSKGTLKFKFFSKDAPNTVKRFVQLVQEKFYNGLAFHRVVPGFVVQGGDPKSRNKNDPTVGTGGSGTRLKAEFNGRKHVRGTVAMARSSDPDSADSQFYFCLSSFPHLDGQYTVFGQVVDYGEKVGDKDVLDRISPWDEIIEMHIE
ncbi:MAG: peptidylprolyl isomerase [Bacteriovoracia bacterium]